MSEQVKHLNVNYRQRCWVHQRFVHFTDPSNQLFSTVGRPISRSPHVWATVNISWTWPPGLTYAPSGPSTDILKISFFWVMTLLHRRQQKTVHYNRHQSSQTAVCCNSQCSITLIASVALYQYKQHLSPPSFSVWLSANSGWRRLDCRELQ